MKIIATPIILENYTDGIIMKKSVFLGVCKKNSVDGRTPEKCIQRHLEDGTVLGDFGDLIIVDRKFYDVTKLVGVYY